MSSVMRERTEAVLEDKMAREVVAAPAARAGENPTIIESPSAPPGRV